MSEAKVLTWVGSCLLGGLGAWLGSIISLNNQPQHSDALAAGVIHFAFEIITSSSVILSPLSCIDVWYFAPIAVLNAWDRAYKGAGNKRKDVRGLDSPPELTMAY